MNCQRRTAMLPVVLLSISIATYVITFSAYTVLKHLVFGDSGFDLGIHDQGLWLLSRGQVPFNTVRGLYQFGDHTWFIMVLLAPLYWIWADVRLLLVFQTLACALGAVPLYLLAREHLDSQWLALAFAAAYLLYPALGNVNLDHFHPEALATPLLLLAFYAGTSGRYRSFAVSTTLALLCKEDVSIVVALMGVYLALSGRRAVGVITTAVAAAWFILCLKLFLPYFNGYGFFRHEGGYWFSGVMSRLTDPAFLSSRFLNLKAARYLFDLLAPAAFLPLLSPMVLGIALAPIAINILSGVGYLQSINYHYTVTITPFIFAAAVCATARAGRSWALRILMTTVLLAAAGAGNAWLSKLPFQTAVRQTRGYWKRATADARVATIREAIALIPDESGVAADPFSVPHLTHRKHIYEFPNPFIPVYWGIHGENPHDPTLVDYIFVKGRLHPRTQRLLDVLREVELFEPVFTKGDIRLLKRNAGTPSRVYGLTGRFYQITSKLLPGREPSKDPLWEGILPTIEFPATTGSFRSLTGTGPPLKDNFAAVFSGSIWIEKPGGYLFRVSGDDGFRLWIDEVEIVKKLSSKPAEVTGGIFLRSGLKKITLEYYEIGGRASLALFYRPPGGVLQAVPPHLLFPDSAAGVG